MKPKKAFSNVKVKTSPSFAVKLAERSNHSFLLSIWWITFFKHLYSLIRVMEYIELNWLCKYLKKMRSSQTVILVLNWVKQSSSLWVSLKWKTFKRICLVQTSEAVVLGCSVKKGVYRNFAKFPGKHLCKGLFLNKIAGRFLQ